MRKVYNYAGFFLRITLYVLKPQFPNFLIY